MKKISIFILIIFCLMLTGCNDETREVKSLNDFEEASINNNFIVNSSLDNYVNDDYITDAKVATLNNIEIEMVIYDNEESAKKVQDKQLDNFMGTKSANAIIKKDKGKNFYKYSMISNRYYMITSRVDNTLIFSSVPVDNKDTVDKIFEELGY